MVVTCQASGDDWSCERTVAGNGLCSSHYWQSRNKPHLTMVRDRVKDKWSGGLRWCGGCKSYLDPTLYCASKGNKDGLANECRTCAMDRQLRINFTITLDQYNEMLEAQGGVCAICARPEPKAGKKLAVDHNHACCPGKKSCGKCVRSLLCSECNMAIGLLSDDSNRLRNAADYIDRWT